MTRRVELRDGLGASVPVDVHTEVSFGNERGEIRVRFDGEGRVRVSAIGARLTPDTLDVQPEASNLITVGLREER